MRGTAAAGRWRCTGALRQRVWIQAVALWVCAYAVLVARGARFSTELLRTGWQYPIPDALASRPLATALSMTVQPPLWILSIGTTIRWVPLPDWLALQVLMFVIGVALVALSSRILERVGLSRRVCLIAAVLAGLHPNLVGNLFTPAYELPTAVLLLAVVHSFPFGGRPATARSLHSLAAAATALVMVRTIFHPIWLVALLLLSVAVHRRAVRRSHLVMSVVVPVLLVLAVVLRNSVIMGVPTWTSWEGMNLLRSVQPAISSGDLQRAYEEGRVSSVARVVTFSEYGQYEPEVGPCAEEGNGVLGGPFGPPAVSAFTGEVVAIPNFNSPCYGAVYRLARSDAWTLIHDHPDRWIAARVVALRTWFTNYPGSGTAATIADLGSVDILSPSTAGWNSFRNQLLFDRPLSLPQIALFVSLIVGAVAAFRRTLRGLRWPTDTVMLLASALYLYSMAVGVVFELGEQARFRWPLEPLAVVALVGQLAPVLARRPFPWNARAGERSTVATEERND